MDEHHDLEARLKALGTQPVDPALQQRHLSAMAGASPRRPLRPKLRTAAAFLAGLLVGGSGLAAAGALPDPAQHAAHQALGEIGVSVPDPERYHGPECGPEAKRNHGAYVRDDKDLARSDCGKPVGRDGSLEADEGDDAEVDVDDGNDGKGPGCQGPPPWAGGGKGDMSPEEKKQAQADRAAQCGSEDPTAESDDGEDGARARPGPTSTTTTTSAPDLPTSTTTTVAPLDPEDPTSTDGS